MARPLKDGFPYFPKDTDFYNDDKVRILRADFGAKGMYLLDYLLCTIYGFDGYYMTWDKQKCSLVCDGTACAFKPAFIEEFVRGCLECSFFDKRVFTMFSVLTSAGIQRRYVRMFNSRNEVRLIKEYCLLDLNDERDIPKKVRPKLIIKSVIGTENPVKSTENLPNKNKVKDISNDISQIKENISDGDDEKERMRVREIFMSYWGEIPNDIDIDKIIDMYRTLDGINDNNNDLLEKALESAANSANKNIAYVKGCFDNFKKRGITSNDEYWEYEYQRDKARGKV